MRFALFVPSKGSSLMVSAEQRMRGASGIIFHHSRSFFVSVRRRSDATTLKKSTIRPVYNSGKYATSHQPWASSAAQPPHPFTSRCRAENLPLQKFTLSLWMLLDNARVRAHTSKGKTRFISEPGLPNLYCHRRRHHNNNLRCAWQSSQQYILCRGRVFSVQGCGSAHTFRNLYPGRRESSTDEIAKLFSTILQNLYCTT